MIKFNADETAVFFNKTYRQVDSVRGQNVETRLHPRDRIFLDRILKSTEPAACRILDFGCGQGRLLATLLERGHDAHGMEKHEEMRAIANAQTQKWATAGERVAAGDVRSLKDLPGKQYDYFVAMGVFQYMAKAEYDQTLAAIARLLKPNGTLIATYQNALFDLFTFNKFTVDFMMHKLLGPELSESEAVDVKRGLEQLLTNPEKPPHSATRARDNIFVHTSNPLTIDGHLRRAGFEVQAKYFYEYFGLPPLLTDKHGSLAAAVRAKFEVTNAEAWQGHFMANAFLVQMQLA